MTRLLDWNLDRHAWPHADASRFVRAGGLRWHVQQMGSGPALLMIHGTGASTHSWRGLAPLLAERFTVVAPDLPGHGFTECPPRKHLSLPAMAAAVAALVDALDLQPSVLIGHSAGAAILIRSCLDGRLVPEALIGINAAVLPFRGPASYLFPPLAKLLFLNPLSAHWFARSAADRERMIRVIGGTGSQLDDAGIDYYARLFSSPAHVAATLGMMASWDLQALKRELAALQTPLLLIAADNDQFIPPTQAEQLARMLSGTQLRRLAGLGHLAHEEDAVSVAALIQAFIGEIAERHAHVVKQQ